MWEFRQSFGMQVGKGRSSPITFYLWFYISPSFLSLPSCFLSSSSSCSYWYTLRYNQWVVCLFLFPLCIHLILWVRVIDSFVFWLTSYLWIFFITIKCFISHLNILRFLLLIHIFYLFSVYLTFIKALFSFDTIISSRYVFIWMIFLFNVSAFGSFSIILSSQVMNIILSFLCILCRYLL